MLAAVRAVTQKAIEEQRVFLNCSILDPVDHANMRKFWQQDIDDAARLLVENPALRSYLPEFIRDTAISNLMMSDVTVPQLVEFCGKHGDWRMDLARLNYTIVKFKLKDVMKSQ
ncbi:MAG: hypothetical protein K2P80_10225 [Beijerinckiaceae bacterium]|nr:hypothetical protein [Beijerinckiaceae bacterium]